MTVITVCAPLSLDPAPLLNAAAARVGRSVDVCYEPSLLPPQRFPADHTGDPTFVRSLSQEARWRTILARTDIALGIPGDAASGLRFLVDTAPALAWVQGTSAGMGEKVRHAALRAGTFDRVTITSAAGIHARPLAEFALFGLLAFAKDLDLLSAHKAQHRWPPRWPMRQLRDQRIVVLGLGGVGREVARLCACFGAVVTGVRRHQHGEPVVGVGRMIGLDGLDDELRTADGVVVSLPGTPETERLLDAARLALMPAHAVVVNVGRGTVIDGKALNAALETGSLRGAVLDVTDPEPLRPDDPLWQRSNAIISPHTAALTIDEDDRIVELFSDNLGRFLTDAPLRNVVDTGAWY